MITFSQTQPKKQSPATQFHSAIESAPEKVIDDLAWLAAQFCCAPMAIISLMGDRGLRIKSKVGLTARETAREFALADETLAQRQSVIILDTLLDDRFSRDAWVASAPKIRFYAGVPLIASSGHTLGVLSVMDRVPRQLSREQIYAVEVLARQIVSHLEWRTAAGRS